MTQITNAQSTPALPSLLSSDTSHLTPESLMFYLQTRLSGLDDQIQGVFAKQQSIEKVRKNIADIQRILSEIKQDVGDAGENPESHPEYNQEIKALIDDIKNADAALGQQLETDLIGTGNGQILSGGYDNTKCSKAEVEASEAYLKDVSSSLESSAQLEMIGLQSLMSARGTAIQLSTNLVSALGESSKTIAANIGR